jgi:hypothetical protein
MSAIIHQVQPTPHACNQTCLAMLLGLPVARVLEVFPSEGMTPRQLHVALDRCHFEWNAFQFGTLVCTGLYLMAVPSLNIEAGGHTILFDWRGCWDDSVVYDPNKGREGKRFYSTNPAEGGVPLRWWTEIIYVVPGGVMPIAN